MPKSKSSPDRFTVYTAIDLLKTLGFHAEDVRVQGYPTTHLSTYQRVFWGQDFEPREEIQNHHSHQALRIYSLPGYESVTIPYRSRRIKVKDDFDETGTKDTKTIRYYWYFELFYGTWVLCCYHIGVKGEYSPNIKAEDIRDFALWVAGAVESFEQMAETRRHLSQDLLIPVNRLVERDLFLTTEVQLLDNDGHPMARLDRSWRDLPNPMKIGFKFNLDGRSMTTLEFKEFITYLSLFEPSKEHDPSGSLTAWERLVSHDDDRNGQVEHRSGAQEAGVPDLVGDSDLEDPDDAERHEGKQDRPD